MGNAAWVRHWLTKPDAPADCCGVAPGAPHHPECPTLVPKAAHWRELMLDRAADSGRILGRSNSQSSSGSNTSSSAASVLSGISLADSASCPEPTADMFYLPVNRPRSVSAWRSYAPVRDDLLRNVPPPLARVGVSLAAWRQWAGVLLRLCGAGLWRTAATASPTFAWVSARHQLAIASWQRQFNAQELRRRGVFCKTQTRQRPGAQSSGEAWYWLGQGSATWIAFALTSEASASLQEQAHLLWDEGGPEKQLDVRKLHARARVI
eukprot:jgi/Tetstr1/465933/TSEL_010547.t1